MSVANVLNCVGGQHTYGVDGSIIKLGPPLRENRV
jgi:hypothetical protein